tara:strand:+ start:292 stop:1521 length:1230 start_codon:yes stop_codon:yes gene_type:complete
MKVTEDGYIIACPSCDSKNMIKKSRQKNYDGSYKQRYMCKDCGTRTVNPQLLDLDIVRENVKLAKQKQSAQDTNRIERKAFREQARYENAIHSLLFDIQALLQQKNFSKFKFKKVKQGKCTGVLQISDTHFNELVSLPHNNYDFKVASRRLKHYINKAKKIFKVYGIKNVLIAITGDLINSDRRLDEMLNMSTNRSKAVFLAVDLLQQVIYDLGKDYSISVACVTGNESRLKQDWGWSDFMASDNYDFVIFEILRHYFKQSNVRFVQDDPAECVVNVQGQNLLLLHGNGSFTTQYEKSVNQIKGRYAGRGVQIDYIISGHIHSARVGDIASRSSSLVGANEYSEKGLNLSGRASQNIYIFHEDKNIDAMKIDLQNVGDECYDIDSELESYNAKSSNKLKPKKTIFEVTI